VSKARKRNTKREVAGSWQIRFHLNRRDNETFTLWMPLVVNQKSNRGESDASGSGTGSGSGRNSGSENFSGRRFGSTVAHEGDSKQQQQQQCARQLP